MSNNKIEVLESLVQISNLQDSHYSQEDVVGLYYNCIKVLKVAKPKVIGIIGKNNIFKSIAVTAALETNTSFVLLDSEEKDDVIITSLGYAGAKLVITEESAVSNLFSFYNPVSDEIYKSVDHHLFLPLEVDLLLQTISKEELADPICNNVEPYAFVKHDHIRITGLKFSIIPFSGVFEGVKEASLLYSTLGCNTVDYAGKVESLNDLILGIFGPMHVNCLVRSILPGEFPMHNNKDVMYLKENTSHVFMHNYNYGSVIVPGKVEANFLKRVENITADKVISLYTVSEVASYVAFAIFDSSRREDCRNYILRDSMDCIIREASPNSEVYKLFISSKDMSVGTNPEYLKSDFLHEEKGTFNTRDYIRKVEEGQHRLCFQVLGKDTDFYLDNEGNLPNYDVYYRRLKKEPFIKDVTAVPGANGLPVFLITPDIQYAKANHMSFYDIEESCIGVEDKLKGKVSIKIYKDLDGVSREDLKLYFDNFTSES